MRHSLALGSLTVCALLAAAPARAQEAAAPARLVLVKPAVTSEPAAPENTTHGRFGQKIDRIVIHTVEGSQGSAVNTFRAPTTRVSAHYVVGKDGSIVQCVADADMAWHAGLANTTAIGIEHEGSFRSAATWTPALLQSSARLTRWLCDTYGVPIDRKHIVGHNEVAGETHQDPGPHFDWPAYMKLVLAAGSHTLPVPTLPAGTAAVSTASEPGLPLPIRLLPFPGSSVAAIESALAASGNQGCFGVPGANGASTPATSGGAKSGGATATTTGNAKSGGATATTTGNAKSGGATAPVTSSSVDPQTAALVHDVAGLVLALDKTFEALEGTIAAVASGRAAASTPSTPAPAPATTAPANEPLCSTGSQGDAVRRIQQLTGAKVDGIYGPETEAAVRAFQQAHGCKVDGIVGPETWGALDKQGTSKTTAPATSAAPAASSKSDSSQSDDGGLAGPAPGRTRPSTSTSTSASTSPTQPAAGEVCQPGDLSAQEGDSLASVAARIGVTEDALARANPQINVSGYLPAGTVVHVPTGN